MGSIGANPSTKVEVGIVTSSGRAYYRITSFLKRMNVPYVDVILGEQSILQLERSCASASSKMYVQGLKVLITTRKERLQVAGDKVVCIEDLGDELAAAKQKLLSLLYPPKPTDMFIVGVDPGERTGIAAFVNHREIETVVSSSMEETFRRLSSLVDNAMQTKKIVKIGYGNPTLAREIAGRLKSHYDKKLKIQLVDERGTSSLAFSRRSTHGTRDQRAARLIAFREGQDYSPN